MTWRGDSEMRACTGGPDEAESERLKGDCVASRVSAGMFFDPLHPYRYETRNPANRIAGDSDIAVVPDDIEGHVSGEFEMTRTGRKTTQAQFQQNPLFSQGHLRGAGCVHRAKRVHQPRPVSGKGGSLLGPGRQPYGRTRRGVLVIEKDGHPDTLPTWSCLAAYAERTIPLEQVALRRQRQILEFIDRRRLDESGVR